MPRPLFICTPPASKNLENATFQIPNTKIFDTCQSSIVSNSMIVCSNGNSSIKSTLNDSTNQLNNNQVSGFDSNYQNVCTPIVFIDQQQQQQQQQQHPQQQQYQHQQTQQIPLNLNTPNNNNSLNGSMTILRGNMHVGSSGPGQQNFSSQCINAMDDTPISAVNVGVSVGRKKPHYEENVVATPYRRQFKYLSAFSPTTPSFGVFPLNSPCPNELSPYLNGENINVSNCVPIHISNVTPSPHTLTEVILEQKAVGKKVPSNATSHVAGFHNVVNRREPSIGHINNNNKPAVFTQGGNVTPRTPINTSSGTVRGGPFQHAAVRRSSRLFSNSAYSVKENNKSPNINSKFAQPRSPPRKGKLRMAKMCLNNELIEDKSIHSPAGEKNVKKHKEKIETITSPHAHVGLSKNKNKRSNGGGGSNGGHYIIHNIPNHDAAAAVTVTTTADNKVLINNSLNNAQTLSHHLLSLKKQSADGLMALLREMAEGFKLISKYQCKAAIKHLEANLPMHHLCSSWVQSLIAISQYELREYESAASVFRRVHEQEPYRLEYMEIYSSSLWHLQREVDLSALAQDLIGQDKLSSVTWCVAGNCFSLHKEHETAIKFFKRAVQVDPDFVYSYTLLGHELVLTEELDKALDYFRAAVVRDSRHYNAWFGIGTIYSKQEKYELAELHYIKALKINPQNSVILVHIAAMQYFMQRKEQALQTLNKAAALDPKNPLARFHRGSIYFSLGRHQEALDELKELKEIVPKESVVFYLIGKIHKALGNVDLALMHFSWATDLDPKGANTQIKDAFDSVTYPSCCPPNVNETDGDLEPVSERSDYSTQTPNDINYDSDY